MSLISSSNSLDEDRRAMGFDEFCVMWLEDMSNLRSCE